MAEKVNPQPVTRRSLGLAGPVKPKRRVTRKELGLSRIEGAVPEPIAEIPMVQGSDSLFLDTPAYSQLIAESTRAMQDAGYDSTTIRNIIQPQGLGQQEDPLDFEKLYEVLSPALQSGGGAAALETWHQLNNLREDGIEFDATQTSALRTILGVFAEQHGEEVLENMADANKWYKRLIRSVAESTAGELATRGALEFGVGLASMDFFAWLNKKQKLPFIPASERADVEARLLPKITLEDHEGKAREFSNGTSAAWWVFGQRVKGVAMIAGEIMQPVRLGHDLATNGFQPEGAEVIASANRQIPALLTSLGGHLSWQEVAERNIDHRDPGNVNDIYQGMYDMGRFGEMQMMGVSLVGGLADIFGDLVVVASVLPTKLGKLGAPIARIAGRAGGEVAAVQAAKIAARTHKFEDALDSLAEAQRHLQKMEAVGKAQAETKSGRMTTEMARRIVLARKQMKNAEHIKRTFEDPGPHEVIMLRRTARRRPELVPDELAAQQMTDSPAVAKELSKTRELELRRDFDIVGTFDDQSPGAISERALLGPDDAEQAGDAINHIVRTGGLGLDDVAITPNAFEYQRRPDTVAGLIKDVDLPRPKTFDEFGNLEKFAKSDLAKSSIRVLLRDLQRVRKSLGEARNVRGPVVTVGPRGKVTGVGPSEAIKRLEAEIVQMRKNKPTQIDGESPLANFVGRGKAGTPQGFIRDTDVLIRRKELELSNLRRALEPNKPHIMQLENQMSTLKKLAKDLSKQDFLAHATKYDDVWLPGSQEPMLASPSRYHNWLTKAGDQVAEGLYPGSLMLTRFWDTKVGQSFSWLREPMRFYESYDPGTGEIIRGTYMRLKRDTFAWNQQLNMIFEEAGVTSQRSKWNPLKQFKGVKIDQAKNEELFNLLDADMATPAGLEMVRNADPKILKAHDQIRKILDHAADVQGISDTEKYLTGYIKHVVTADQFAGGARPPEFIGLPAKAEVFAPHLLNRAGATGYPPDAVQMLDLYGRAMYRKLYLEPMFDTVLANGQKLSAEHRNPMFSQYSNMLVNHLKGKPSFIGNMVDQMIGGAVNAGTGRPRWTPGATDRALVGLTGLFWAGTLAGNPRYPIMQMATGILTTSSRYGIGRTTKGLWQMATPEGQAIAKQIGVYDEFLDIFESPAMKQFSIMMSKVPAITPLGVMSTSSTEFMIRGASALSAMDLYLTKLGFSSLDEAFAAGFGKRVMFESLRGAEETNHMYGALGRTPVASAFLPKGMVVSGTQFLSFVPKQIEELLAQTNRNPGAIAQYLMLSGWLSRVAAQEMGIDLTEYVGLGFIPEGGDELTSPAISALIEGFKMTAAIGNNDPDAAAMHTQRFLETLDNLIPLMVAWESAAKTATRLTSGEVRTGTGELTRTLDFKKIMEDPELSLMQRIAQSIRPDPATGIGGDFIPTITGQRNINDALFRRGKLAITAQKKERLFRTKNVARNMVQAALDGDLDRLKKAQAEFNELVENDELRITTTDPFEAAAEAASISWVLRELSRNKKYADQILEMLERSGIEVK